MRKELATRLFETGIIPVIKISHPDFAEPLGQALANGGLPVAEITYRTPAAGESIRRLRAAFPDMLLAAGTVLNVAQAQEALNNGADCIVSPGMPPKLTAYCLEREIPFMPGVCTPTEICTAMEQGLTRLKFFPASNYGGLKTAKAFLGVFGALELMPTGGISLENAPDYLQTKGIFCCGGSFIAPAAQIEDENFAAIEATARQVCDLVTRLNRIQSKTV